MTIDEKLYKIIDEKTLFLEDEYIYGGDMATEILEHYNKMQFGTRLGKISDRPEESKEFVMDSDNYILLNETFEDNSDWIKEQYNYNPYSDASFVQMEYLMYQKHLDKIITDIGINTAEEYKFSKELINEIKGQLNGEYDEEMSKNFIIENHTREYIENSNNYENPEINF